MRTLVQLSPEMATVMIALANVDFAAERAALERAEAIVAANPLELRGLLLALAAMRSVHEGIATASAAIPSMQDLAEAMALVDTVPRDAIARAIADFEGRRH